MFSLEPKEDKIVTGGRKQVGNHGNAYKLVCGKSMHIHGNMPLKHADNDDDKMMRKLIESPRTDGEAQIQH